MEKNSSKDEMVDVLNKAKTSAKRLNTQIYKLLKNTVMYSAVAMASWDNDSKIITCNDAFANLFQVNKEDLIGCNFFNKDSSPGTIYEKDREYSLKAYNGDFHNNQNLIVNHYTRCYKADGNLIWVKWIKAWNDLELGIGAGQITIATSKEIKKEVEFRKLFK